jgi:hypothetical protein
MSEKRQVDSVLLTMKPYLRSTALIMVMKAADLGNPNYLFDATGGRFQA